MATGGVLPAIKSHPLFHSQGEFFRVATREDVMVWRYASSGVLPGGVILREGSDILFSRDSVAVLIHVNVFDRFVARTLTQPYKHAYM